MKQAQDMNQFELQFHHKSVEEINEEEQRA